MPIGIDPNDTTKVKLAFDRQLPEEKRTVFECRFLSTRDTKKVAALTEASRASKDDDETDRLINEAIMVGIVGWENASDAGEAIPFSADGLLRLSWYQKFEIACQYPGAVMVAEIDRKKSAGPPLSTTAPAAAAPSADA